MKALLLSLVLTILATFGGVASAQDAPELAHTEEADEASEPIDLQTVAGHVRGYYRGERISAFMVLGLGVAGIGTGIPLLLQDDDFARGAGWTLLIVGALQAIGSVIYAVEVTGLMEHYGAALERDPAAFKEEETEHMAGTIDRFPIYLTTEIVLTLAGVGIAIGGFAADEDVYKGMGIALAALWFPVLIIDLVNQARGRTYADRVGRTDVTAVSATIPPSTAPSDNIDRLADAAAISDGFYLSLSRSF